MDQAVLPVNATLSLIDFFFDKCIYERNADPVLENGIINYQFGFNRRITRVDDKTWQVSLQGNVETSKKEIEMHVRVVGLFSIDAEDKVQKNRLVSKNTVAILFPYLRSQITLVTAQSGLPPIVLPLLNIAEMFKDAPLPGEKD